MVPDLPDNFPEADHRLYRDLKAPVCRIMDEEKNHHRTSACLQQSLSTSCVSGLTLEDSWSVDLLDHEFSTLPAQDRVPAPPLRGRRSLVRRTEEEQDDRFAAVLQPQDRLPSQRSLCTPPTRRPSSDCSVLTSDSSTIMVSSMDLTSAHKSFNDSAVISVATEVLEQDPNPNQIHRSLPYKTNSRGINLPTKTPRRLTPTLEVPEEQEPSNWVDEELDEIPSEHPPVEAITTTSTTFPLRDCGARSNPPTKPRRNYTRESITLESAVIKAPSGNHLWGVKSSLTLDSALFDESAVGLDEPEDDCPSKRTSWAVGSSLTFATFEDSLTAMKPAGHDQIQSNALPDHPHMECVNPILNNDFLCQEMNRLRFSSHGDSLQKSGSERTIPSTFSSITPCTKPIRAQSIPKTSNKDSSANSP